MINGEHRVDVGVIDNFIARKTSYAKLLSWKIFLKDIVVSGSKEDRPKKRKNYTLEKTFFFTEICFPWNFLIRLVSFSNGCTHEYDINKKSSEKNSNKCSVKKEFWITFLSVRVQSANAWKRKTVFRLNFFGYRKLVSWKT